MTKEEIREQYKEWGEKGGETINWDDCLKAMDVYAKQEAIEFSHWINKHLHSGNQYITLSNIPYNLLTVEELHEKYLQSKQQQ